MPISLVLKNSPSLAQLKAVEADTGQDSVLEPPPGT